MLFYYSLKDKIKKHPFIQNRVLLVLSGLSLVLNGIIWYIIYTRFRLEVLQSGSDLITLHYNIFLGTDLFGPFHMIYRIPSIGLAILILNIVLAVYLYQRTKILAYYLIVMAFLSQIIVGGALYLIMQFNI